MKQNFKLLDDGKVKWTYEKEEQDSEDKDFGVVGKTGSFGYIIFDSKEKALTILDRDLSECESRLQYQEEQMKKNNHNLDKFSQIKELIESIAKLHTDFKEIKNIPEKLYADNPKKYQKLLRDFNNAKSYIVDELSAFNKEYQKYLNYQPAKKAYDFEKEQLGKIKEQRDMLLEL